MNSREQGFSLVELMIVAALSAVVMTAIYQTLVVQQKSNRQLNAVVATQQTLRTSMQFLQGEFRELGATSGDIVAAAPESLTFRALRKAGIVCAHASATALDVYKMGSDFSNGDSVLFFADRGDKGFANDTVRLGVISAAPGAAGGSCATIPAGRPWSSMTMAAERLTVTLAAGALTDISDGAVIRSYEKLTYGVFSKNGSYVLGRRNGGSTDTVVTLIGPLAPPGQAGLKLEYFDTLNQALPTGSLSAANVKLIGRIKLTLRGSTPGAGSSTHPTYSDTLVTNIYLRGNPS